jgi:transposase
VKLFEEIRRDKRLNPEVSVRALARRHGTHRRMVKAALESATPPPRKEYPKRSTLIDPFVGVIDSWLIADKTAPPKQRHTARRVWQRLVREEGATVSEVTVSRYVAARRIALGLVEVDVYVPQDHAPGAEAEVDFGEFWSLIEGEWVKLHMFSMRLSCSGKAFHMAFLTQAQEAFFLGHVEAFAYFGAVPARIRYDNLKPAVVKIMRGRNRVENERFIALRSHYGFDSFYCRPAVGNEKGGVEGEIGRFRREHLTPVPDVASVTALNEVIAAADVFDDQRVITGRPVTVGAAFAQEFPTLGPLPAEPFDHASLLSARVDTHARISVRQNRYSVPARLAGRRVTVRLSATHVEVLDGSVTVALHERAAGRHVDVLELDHYLEVLTKKPGATLGSRPLAQARKSGTFTDAHQAYWDAARRARGDREGTQALIEVLLAHRTLSAEAICAALETAVASGVLEAASVIIDARRAGGEHIAPVIPIGALTKYDRPAPSLDWYDVLLVDDDMMKEIS